MEKGASSTESVSPRAIGHQVKGFFSDSETNNRKNAYCGRLLSMLNNDLIIK